MTIHDALGHFYPPPAGFRGCSHPSMALIHLLAFLLCLAGSPTLVTAQGDATPSLQADFTGDNRVDAKDLLQLLNDWHRNSSTIGDSTEDLFYYSGGGKIFMIPSETQIAVVFREGVDETGRFAFLADYADLDHFLYETALPGGLFPIALSRTIGWPELNGLLDIWADDERVFYVTPVFTLADGSFQQEFYLTDTFIALFTPEVTTEEIEAFNQAHDVLVVESGEIPFRNGRYLLKPRLVKNALQVLQMANIYYESDLTVFSHPNFANAVSILALTSPAEVSVRDDRGLVHRAVDEVTQGIVNRLPQPE